MGRRQDVAISNDRATAPEAALVEERNLVRHLGVFSQLPADDAVPDWYGQYRAQERNQNQTNHDRTTANHLDGCTLR